MLKGYISESILLEVNSNVDITLFQTVINESVADVAENVINAVINMIELIIKKVKEFFFGKINDAQTMHSEIDKLYAKATHEQRTKIDAIDIDFGTHMVLFNFVSTGVKAIKNKLEKMQCDTLEDTKALIAKEFGGVTPEDIFNDSRGCLIEVKLQIKTNHSVDKMFGSVSIESAFVKMMEEESADYIKELNSIKSVDTEATKIRVYLIKLYIEVNKLFLAEKYKTLAAESNLVSLYHTKVLEIMKAK